MGIKRYELSIAQWEQIRVLLPGKASDRVRGTETILFEYDDTWLQDAGRFSLEPVLALTRGAFAPPAGLTIFRSIGDSAPDTWGRLCSD